MLSFAPFPKMEYTTGKDKQSYYSIFFKQLYRSKSRYPRAHARGYLL